MKRFLVSSLCLSIAAISGLAAHAGEIKYHCEGTYDSKQAADTLDPSTISVHAQLEATVSDAQGRYTLVSAKLTMKATNEGDKDAGSIEIQKGVNGKLNQAHDPKYKNHIRFDIGSNLGDVYENDGDTPETYLLIPVIPTDDSGTVYVQRSGSGHDVYPTIDLKCGD